MKRVISIVMSVIMAFTVFTCLDLTSSYASTVISKTGSDGITWTLDSTGTLTITGSGAMSDIDSGYPTGTGYYYDMTDEEKYDAFKWHYNYKDSIKKIVIKSGITKIGQYSFYGCSNVTSISIPSGVKIGAYAFYGCTGLTSVTIPDNCSFLGLDWNINGTCYAFQNCTNLKTLVLGKNVDLSSQAAFMGCTGLTNLTIGAGDKISTTAFKNCSSVTDLTIDSTATYTSYTAFQWFSNIKNLILTGSGTFSGFVENGNVYNPWIYSASSGTLKSVTVKTSITGLADRLFGNETSITSITLPSTLTTIGAQTFYGCTGLTSISIPASTTSIGSSAFQNVNAKFYVYKGSYADTYLTNLGKTVYYSGGPIGSATVTLSQTSYEYDGTEKKPSVTVKLGSTTLTNGTNYTVSYKDNILPGTATVVVTGKGNFTGSVSKTFTITGNAPVSIESATVTLSQNSYEYDGTEKKPSVTVKLGSTTLTNGTDYTVSYENNIEPGTATVVVSGKGTYTGTASKTFTITEKATASIESAAVILSQDSYEYDGTEKKPSVTVKLGSTTLTNGTDYTVSYENNIEPGTATVVVTGKGDYTGTVSKTFTITEAIESESNYLTFTAQKPSSTIYLDYPSSNLVEYSLDGENWIRYSVKKKIVLSSMGDKVMFRGKNISLLDTPSSTPGFTMTGKIAASGSVTSLTDMNGKNTDVSLTEGCYANMFEGCAALTSAPELPAATLADYCYGLMFVDCTGLTKAPELPATNLAAECYVSMFAGCTGLTSAPELPATTLDDYCYTAMFADCTGLARVPELPSTTLGEGCYQQMFAGCSGIKIYSVPPYNHLYLHMDTWCIPAEATTSMDWDTRIFKDTRGDITDGLVPGKIYYQAKSENAELICKEVVEPAGYLYNGKNIITCAVCGELLDEEPIPGYSNYYVKSFKVSRASKAFVAKWKKQSKSNQKKFNGYQIRYATDADFTDVKYATASKSSKSKKIKKLKKKTKYYVQVRTYTVKDGIKYYSKWSALKKVTTK